MARVRDDGPSHAFGGGRICVANKGTAIFAVQPLEDGKKDGGNVTKNVPYKSYKSYAQRCLFVFHSNAVFLLAIVLLLRFNPCHISIRFFISPSAFLHLSVYLHQLKCFYVSLSLAIAQAGPGQGALGAVASLPRHQTSSTELPSRRPSLRRPQA